MTGFILVDGPLPASWPSSELSFFRQKGALPVVVWVHFAWNSDFEGLLTGAIWVWAGTQTGYV
jgi:hypothetical protein